MYQVISCGVNRPANGAPLAYAEKDASDISAVFESAIGPVNAAGVTTLLGDDASHDGIFGAFLEVSDRQPDYLVFYFSGHGNDDGVATATGLLGYDTLASLIRIVDSPYTFVILDVCSAASAAPFLKEAQVGGLGALKESWLAALASATPGTRLIFSTGAGRNAGEHPNLCNGIFTYYFVKALRESGGDLGWGDARWVSDQAASFAARQSIRAAGFGQVPLYFNLTGDFPLTLSQRDAPVGDAHFTRTAVSPHSLDVSFRLALREGLKTVLTWKLCNGRGNVIASGRYTKEAPEGAKTFSGSIPFPHAEVKSDSYTRVHGMASGSAPICWSLALHDETNNVLDEAEVRAYYSVPQLAIARRR